MITYIKIYQNLNSPNPNSPNRNCPEPNYLNLNCPNLNCPNLNSPNPNSPDLNCPNLNCPNLNWLDLNCLRAKYLQIFQFFNLIISNVERLYHFVKHCMKNNLIMDEIKEPMKAKTVLIHHAIKKLYSKKFHCRSIQMEWRNGTNWQT